MSKAIVERLLFGVVLIVAVVVLDFLLLQLAPGDIVDTILTEAGAATRSWRPPSGPHTGWISPCTSNS